MDECTTIAPCEHNGICINLEGSFRCECNDKYTGEFCELIKQITCNDRPCRNGSTCTDVVNQKTGDNFTCACLTGYEDKLCDKPYCEIKKCKNAGICLYRDQVRSII